MKWWKQCMLYQIIAHMSNLNISVRIENYYKMIRGMDAHQHWNQKTLYLRIICFLATIDRRLMCQMIADELNIAKSSVY